MLKFHAVVLAAFASIIAPFGGFFASGFKRGFKIKDFGDSIPGHGGMTDRMDCQVCQRLYTCSGYCCWGCHHCLQSKMLFCSCVPSAVCLCLGTVTERLRVECTAWHYHVQVRHEQFVRLPKSTLPPIKGYQLSHLYRYSVKQCLNCNW